MRLFPRLSRWRRVAAHLLLAIGLVGAVSAYFGYIPSNFGVPLAIVGLIPEFLSYLTESEQEERAHTEAKRAREDSERGKRMEEKLDRLLKRRDR
jgi:hypothetical protein